MTSAVIKRKDKKKKDASIPQELENDPKRRIDGRRAGSVFLQRSTPKFEDRPRSSELSTVCCGLLSFSITSTQIRDVIVI